MPFLDAFDEDDDLDDWPDNQLPATEALGPCCACGESGPTVRNIHLLHRLSPTPGRGWGCVACGLPSDYASAVLCDACHESGAEIRFVCTGYPGSDGRSGIEMAPPVKVKHNPLYHPEMLQNMTWFDDSPDAGDPACICSVCGDLIPDPFEEEDNDAPGTLSGLRLYRKPSKQHPHGQEARFCGECGPAVVKYMLH